MKGLLLLMALAAVVVLGLTGCPGAKTETAPTPQPKANVGAPEAQPTAEGGAPLGSIKVGDKAVCAVCAAKGEGHGPEEVKATVDYQGKTYAFCSEEEKAEFIRGHTK